MAEKVRGNAGGDIIFKAGSGQPATDDEMEGWSGSVRFQLADGYEVLRFSPQGTFIHGKEVRDPDNIYSAFKRWLSSATVVSDG